MKNATIGVLIVLTALASTTPAAGDGFSHVVAFGDSLTDTGNVFSATSDSFVAGLMAIFFPDLDLPIPQAPYFEGRFSNGPVWVEVLNQRLGLSALSPSEEGGFNFAVGGAKTTSDNLANLIFPVDVENQVTAYLQSHTPTGDELFIVEGGANDLLSGGQTDVGIPTDLLIGFVDALSINGGRHFLVPNLPPLGKIPSEVGGNEEAILDARAAAFNNQLDLKLDLLELNRPDLDIIRADFFGGMQAILASLSAFGFTNLTDEAYDPVAGTIVPNVDEYLFWDDIHPTARAHTFLGNLAADAVLAEPLGIVGDYNASGDVEIGDLNLVHFNWNDDGGFLTSDWIDQRPPAGSTVGLDALNGVLFNWGNMATVATVPEPTGALLSFGVVLMATYTQRRANRRMPWRRRN